MSSLHSAGTNRNSRSVGIKVQVWKTVWELYCKGYDSFYVNCDYGTPMWAAEFILNLKAGNKIELHIMTPYEEQTTDWPEELRNRYFAIHEKADSVTLVNTHYYPFCYQETDEEMIARSDLLLVFGGKTAHRLQRNMPEREKFLSSIRKSSKNPI